MPRQPKRRFLGLKVGEVSLVDTPANELEFMVTKNLEDDDMDPKTGTNEVEKVSVETSGAGDSDVTKALEHVNRIVENITDVAKKGGAKKAAPMADDGEEEDASKGVTLKTLLSKAGIPADKMDAAVKALKEAGFDANQKFPTGQAPLSKTTKAVEEAAVADPDAAITAVLQTISKAKALTPSRIAKLKEANDILKQILIDAIGEPDGSPSTTVPTSPMYGKSGVKDAASPDNEPVIKSASGASVEDITKAVAAALAPVLKQVGDIATEVEAIKSARRPSNSLEDEGGSDTKKVEKSMWSGVL